jgi:tol-pal system protein YbgF
LIKLRNIFLVLSLGTAACVSGCAIANEGSFVRLQQDLESVKKEVAAVKASAASSSAGRSEGSELQSVRKSMADLSSSYDQVKSDVVESSTRADEMRLQAQKESARLSDRINEQEQTIQAMRAKVAKIDEMEKRLAAIEQKTERLTVAPPVAAPVPAPQDWKSPEEMYDYALGLIKGGDYRKGRDLLTAFQSRYPSHKLIPNVLYWKGESFYGEKDYESAILSFQDVIDKHPAGDKAPDAMYKQGLSFIGLKDKKSARIVLELLVSKHPKSPAATMARQRLAELK